MKRDGLNASLTAVIKLIAHLAATERNYVDEMKPISKGQLRGALNDAIHARTMLFRIIKREK